MEEEDEGVWAKERKPLPARFSRVEDAVSPQLYGVSCIQIVVVKSKSIMYLNLSEWCHHYTYLHSTDFKTYVVMQSTSNQSNDTICKSTSSLSLSRKYLITENQLQVVATMMHSIYSSTTRPGLIQPA